jgi:hypothetical protein
MNEGTLMNEEAWVEEAKRRIKLMEPGVPSAKVKIFIKMLRQEFEATGVLTRDHVDQLLQKLNRGEL